MVYQNLYINNTTVIPKKLLDLFKFYQKDISEHSSKTINNFKICETSEEYITNKILSTKKSDKSFNEKLFEYIDNANISDVELYKKADIDRRLFSKIKSNNDYHPSFGTVTAFALALELSTEEYENLLKSASYSLPMNTYVNITLKYCFDNKIYNLNTVNSFIFTVANKTIKDL